MFEVGDYVVFVKNNKKFIGIVLNILSPNMLSIVELYQVQRFDNRDSGYKHLFREDELKPANPIVKVLYG